MHSKCQESNIENMKNLIFNKNIIIFLLNKCHITEFGMKTNVKNVLIGEKTFAKNVKKKIANAEMKGNEKGDTLEK